MIELFILFFYRNLYGLGYHFTIHWEYNGTKKGNLIRFSYKMSQKACLHSKYQFSLNFTLHYIYILFNWVRVYRRNVHGCLKWIIKLYICFYYSLFLKQAVHIPGLGIFTFTSSKLDIGHNKFILIQRPVFILSEKLIKTHRLTQSKYHVPGMYFNLIS